MSLRSIHHQDESFDTSSTQGPAASRHMPLCVMKMWAMACMLRLSPEEDAVCQADRGRVMQGRPSPQQPFACPQGSGKMTPPRAPFHAQLRLGAGPTQPRLCLPGLASLYIAPSISQAYPTQAARLPAQGSIRFVITPVSIQISAVDIHVLTGSQLCRTGCHSDASFATSCHWGQGTQDS